jgi:hypothetical protein
MPILCGPAHRFEVTIDDPDGAMLRLDDLDFRP